MVAHVTFVSHAMTDALRRGAFPHDESLTESGQRTAAQRANSLHPVATEVVAGPEKRARHTAQLMSGTEPRVAEALRDLDAGSWRGMSLTALAERPPDAAELAQWMADPKLPCPGGESIADVISRVRNWLVAVPAGARLWAFAHPAILRAAVVTALEVPPITFWRIDAEPLATVTLVGHGERWSLRLR